MHGRPNLILLMLLIFIQCGCALTLTKTVPYCRVDKSYEVGLIGSATIGSSILSVSRLHLYPCYKPRYEFMPPQTGGLDITPLKTGQRWVGYYKLNDNYIVISEGYCKGILGIELHPQGTLGNTQAWINMRGIKTPTETLYLLTGPQQIKVPIVRLVQFEWELPDKQLFEETDGEPAEEGSFRAELLYNGIMNKVIIFTYREFIDNLARPAFFQEVKYDLREGDTITFKSLRIKVIRATNSEIQYQVLDDGGLPWLPKG